MEARVCFILFLCVYAAYASTTESNTKNREQEDHIKESTRNYMELELKPEERIKCEKMLLQDDTIHTFIPYTFLSDLEEIITKLFKGFAEEKRQNIELNQKVVGIQRNVQEILGKTDEFSASLENFTKLMAFMNENVVKQHSEIAEKYTRLHADIQTIKHNVKEVQESLVTDDGERLGNLTQDMLAVKEKVKHVQQSQEKSILNVSMNNLKGKLSSGLTSNGTEESDIMEIYNVDITTYNDVSASTVASMPTQMPTLSGTPIITTSYSGTPINTTTVTETAINAIRVTETPIIATTFSGTPIIATTVAETPMNAIIVPETPIIATTVTETAIIATTVTVTPIIATTVTETPINAIIVPESPIIATTVTETAVIATTVTETPINAIIVPETAIIVTTVNETPIITTTVTETAIINTKCPATETPKNIRKSCLALFYNERKTVHVDGIYNITLSQTGPISVYCDMTSDGGGWTVFQRRLDGSVDFARNWDEYKTGFGNMSGEFWLGNKYLNLLTDNDEPHELRIELEDHDGNRAFAKYYNFTIGPESTNYRLQLDSYIGNAGDSLEKPRRGGLYEHDGMEFSAMDRDNDKSNGSCAVEFKGAWWYNSCFESNLNSVYNDQPLCMKSWACIVWNTWKGSWYSLKSTEMKFR